MNDIYGQRCAVHNVALRPDGTCVVCQRGRPQPTSPVARPLQGTRVHERAQNPIGTALLGVLFVLSVAFCLWWFLSPETLKALFE